MAIHLASTVPIVDVDYGQLAISRDEGVDFCGGMLQLCAEIRAYSR